MNALAPIAEWWKRKRWIIVARPTEKRSIVLYRCWTLSTAQGEWDHLRRQGWNSIVVRRA